MIGFKPSTVYSLSDVTTIIKSRRMSHEACSMHGKDEKCIHFSWEP
jgi:hypothetical protein